MRTAYHEQLAALSEQLGEMCGLAGSPWNAQRRRCCRPTW
ncbi:hypothetical protein I552_2597 [Mycobacterium xenopi 3993]|nr:hypothetical protein I552_2597 [Mycobacterium xenopi 3993]